MLTVMSMRIWRPPFLPGQRRPAWVVTLPRSKDLIRSRGKPWSVSTPLSKPTASNHSPYQESRPACSHPRTSLSVSAVRSFVRDKGLPSQWHLQFHKQTALKRQKLMVGFQVSVVGGVRCLDRDIKLCSCIQKWENPCGRTDADKRMALDTGTCPPHLGTEQESKKWARFRVWKESLVR